MLIVRRMVSRRLFRVVSSGLALLALACLWLGVSYAWQQPFRVYRSLEPFDDIDLPSDYLEKTEWVYARLMYPPHPKARFSRPDGGSGGRTGGGRHELVAGLSARGPAIREAVRRLTRVHVRSVEQPVNLDDGDDIINWPWMVRGRDGRLEAD